jgi:hypothetical protein
VLPAVRDNLLPILRRRVHLYLCGHEHDLQVLSPEDGVHFAIVGGGGATPRAVGSGPRTRFAASKNGFAVIEANSKTLTFTLLDGDLHPLHSFTIGDWAGGATNAPSDAPAKLPTKLQTKP